MKIWDLKDKLKLIPIVASFLVATSAGVLLVIWLTQPHLKEFSALTMKANTALGLLLGASSLWCLKDQAASHQERVRVGRVFSLFVFLIGALTGIQYVFDVDLRIDELIELAKTSDIPAIKSKLKEIVPEYTPQ